MEQINKVDKDGTYLMEPSETLHLRFHLNNNKNTSLAINFWLKKVSFKLVLSCSSHLSHSFLWLIQMGQRHCPAAITLLYFLLHCLKAAHWLTTLFLKRIATMAIWSFTDDMNDMWDMEYMWYISPNALFKLSETDLDIFTLHVSAINPWAFPPDVPAVPQEAMTKQYWWLKCWAWQQAGNPKYYERHTFYKQ